MAERIVERRFYGDRIVVSADAVDVRITVETRWSDGKWHVEPESWLSVPREDAAAFIAAIQEVLRG